MIGRGIVQHVVATEVNLIWIELAEWFSYILYRRRSLKGRGKTQSQNKLDRELKLYLVQRHSWPVLVPRAFVVLVPRMPSMLVPMMTFA